MRIAIVLVGRSVPGFNDLADALSKEFKAQMTMDMMNPPMTRAFRGGRGQFDADALLKDLSRMAPMEAERTLFVIREDMFSGDLNFVFGLAKGRVCMVSTARLDPRFYGEKDMAKARSLYKERLIKEAIHELGHTLGLPHCQDKKCAMVYSHTISDVDFKGRGFCERCRKALYLDKE